LAIGFDRLPPAAEQVRRRMGVGGIVFVAVCIFSAAAYTHVLQWADDQLVAVQARLHTCVDTDELVRTIDRLERELKAAFPGARWIFFEPELKEHGTHPL
jgi:hypothetical protein